jgi:hypothetical protein
VVLDAKLPVKQALNIMHAAGLVSCPVYNQKKWRFSGMLTLLDIIHLIQWYYLKSETFETAAADVETFRIESLRSECYFLPLTFHRGNKIIDPRNRQVLRKNSKSRRRH